MAPIAGATSILAYKREASRLADVVPRVSGKIVTREGGMSLGPFSVSYTAKDYEFDLTGAGVSSSFADALDAAAQTQSLDGLTNATPEPNALTTRQALASYRNTQQQPLHASPTMFSATV